MKDICTIYNSLNIDDAVAVFQDNGSVRYGTLKDIFDDQALVALSNKSDSLVLVHRDNIARVDFGLLIH